MSGISWTAPRNFDSLEQLTQWADREIGARRSAVSNDVAVCMLPLHPFWGVLLSPTNLGAALFPAIFTCCACLEALAAFRCGKAGEHGPSLDEIADFASHYCGWNKWATKALFKLYRHKLAHLFAPGANVECELEVNGNQMPNARVTWATFTNMPAEHFRIVAATPENINPSGSPWDGGVQYALVICLKSLQTGVINAADSFLHDIRQDAVMQENFERAMVQVYGPPRKTEHA